MICCEICNKAGDQCEVTGTPIEWSECGLTIMDDCPEMTIIKKEKEDSEWRTEDSD